MRTAESKHPEMALILGTIGIRTEQISQSITSQGSLTWRAWNSNHYLGGHAPPIISSRSVDLVADVRYRSKGFRKQTKSRIKADVNIVVQVFLLEENGKREGYYRMRTTEMMKDNRGQLMLPSLVLKHAETVWQTIADFIVEIETEVLMDGIYDFRKDFTVV